MNQTPPSPGETGKSEPPVDVKGPATTSGSGACCVVANPSHTVNHQMDSNGIMG